MKIKASTLTKLSIAILAAGSLAACNQNKGTASTQSTTPAPSNSLVVFVNQDSLMAKYDYAKDMRKRLDDKGAAAKNDVGTKQQAIQREVAEYQKNVGSMSANERSMTEQRLQRESQEFQQYQQNAGAQFQNETADESKKLYDKIYTFSKQYAKDNGYKIVLTFQTGNTQLLYGDSTLDVTGDFVKKLNEAYSKEKK
ncbi:OmpH family outer membrane protein [Mucilaginibacter ginsenosidivorans]|uniref:OmpH family outer membrane protein n=1 Tax=Mucilaginibacter ginsenosidivorans TaxID=398053 RepID=A0A5B8V305_9SPHI|nr:OmpH family outer membrane protein [Mucilaginibacter ginsenosidivorans]QEC65071.1 OmpH family outer membrane protein [Mucilaginibacter ginsenosidivorans]